MAPGNREGRRRRSSDTISFVTLHDATISKAASTDSVGFERGTDRAAINEVQCPTGPILAIKVTVDADPRSGRLLPTGSADLVALPRVADSLSGRKGIVRLHLLTHAELRGAAPDMFDMASAGQPPTFQTPVVGDSLCRGRRAVGAAVPSYHSR